MPNPDLKEEIKQIIDTIPNSALNELLLYLKEIKRNSEFDANYVTNLNKILKEDRELLRKLAQ